MNPQHSQSCNVRGGALGRQESRKVLGNRTNQPTYSAYPTNGKKAVTKQQFNGRQKSIRLSG